MKIKLTKVVRSDKDKAGNLLKTKDGRAYSRIGIQTKEYGDKWISGFVGYWNENWVEGQIVGAVVEPNGDFLNLKKPDPVAELEERVKALEAIVYQSRVETRPATPEETAGLPF